MPYISASDYEKVRHLLEPPRQPSSDVDVEKLERDIYALNRQIRALPDGITPEWQSLMQAHKRLLNAYRLAGGQRL